MEFTQLFRLMYTKFRGEEAPPGPEDPEWEIAVTNYNDALHRLVNYDGTKWDFLYATAQTDGDGVNTISTGVTAYSAPSDASEFGSKVTIRRDDGAYIDYPVVKPHETQVLSTNTPYAYFTGNNQSGFTLNINPAPTEDWNGADIDYIYYRIPAQLDPTGEDGTSIIEGGDPAFYYMHMVAQRFLDSRNYSSYQVALRDSEQAIQGMRLVNNTGPMYNTWGLIDTGPGFGS